MRLRTLILLLALLLVVAVGVGCAENTRSEDLTTLSTSTARTSLERTTTSTSDPGTETTASAAATGTTASTVPAQTGIPLPTIAPLNEAFLDTLFRPAVDAASIAAVGHPLGLRPLSQDFLYAQGIQIPGLGELELPGLGTPQTVPETLPRSHDLRTRGKVSAVGDQNPYGTCWSFATTGSLESCLLPNERWDLSEDNMVLTSGFDNDGDPYNWGGNLQMSTAYLVRWGGPVDADVDAYGDSRTPPRLTPRKHVQEVDWIPARGGPLDNDNVKRAVMRYGGVWVAMSWQDSASGSVYYDAINKSYYYFGYAYANHAVLIVGWDDDYPASNFVMPPFGDGAFIVKNSWGTEFGDEGYFYVSYYDNVFGRSDLMGVFNNAEPTGNYSGIYQYDPLGDVNAMGYGSPTAWFANVFTAKETSSLGAVGFYTLTPGTSYTVYAGPSLASLQPAGSGTLAYMGYHTVKLAEPVPLKKDGQFVVAVKVTSPGTDDPIAIEYPIARFSSAATAEPGQSNVSPNGTDWSDLTVLWDPNANVCLKAYVLK
jgi:C1A family cysteine protease